MKHSIRNSHNTFASFSRKIPIVAAAMLVSGTIVSTSAQAGQVTTRIAPKPKLSRKQAETIAVKKISGKIVSSKYEFEDGRWQYAVIVTDKSGQMFEVEVNSTTGRVMDTEKTSAASEAKEEAADKKAAASKNSAKTDREDEKM